MSVRVGRGWAARGRALVPRRSPPQAFFGARATLRIAALQPAVLVLHLPSPSFDRGIRSSIGASAALSAAAALSSLPLARLSWARVGPTARPDAVLSPGGAPCGASISLSYDGPLLLVGFARACGGGGRVGVDVLRCARAAAALEAAGGGDGGARLLRARGGRLPAPAGPPLPPATLFALRWTLMEAVLKARGEGLGVAGAAEAVLEGAEEDGEEDEGRGGGGGAGGVRGARVWEAAVCGEGAPALQAGAAQAAAAAAAAGGDSGGSGAGVRPLGTTLLAAFKGAGWRAAVYAAEAAEGPFVFAVATASTPRVPP